MYWKDTSSRRRMRNFSPSSPASKLFPMVNKPASMSITLGFHMVLKIILLLSLAQVQLLDATFTNMASDVFHALPEIRQPRLPATYVALDAWGNPCSIVIPLPQPAGWVPVFENEGDAGLWSQLVSRAAIPATSQFDNQNFQNRDSFSPIHQTPNQNLAQNEVQRDVDDSVKRAGARRPDK